MMILSLEKNSPLCPSTVSSSKAFLTKSESQKSSICLAYGTDIDQKDAIYQIWVEHVTPVSSLKIQQTYN